VRLIRIENIELSKQFYSQVFQELDTNKQKIVERYYPLYKKGTIVIKKPEKAGEVAKKLFNLDREQYIIVDSRGRKYSLAKFIDHIEGKLEPSTKFYQPYEIRASFDGKEFLKYLNSELIKKSLVKLYGLHRFHKINN
jgi:hypothetical protein